MFRVVREDNQYPGRSLFRRYGLAVASVAAAFPIDYLFSIAHIRSPFAYVFLIAFVITLWCAGTGPAILAAILGLLVTNNFTHLPTSWFDVGVSNVPLLLTFALTGWGMARFSRALHAEMDRRTAENATLSHRYKTMLDAAQSGFALFDVEGRIIVDCNREYESMLGYNPEELVGTSAPLPGEEKGAWEDIERELRTGRKIVRHKTTRIRKDGSRFPATISLTPLFDETDGRFMGAVGSIIDDTQQEADELERMMLATLIANNPDAVWVSNLDGSIRFANHTAIEMFGIEPETKGHLLDYFADEERKRAHFELIPTVIREKRLHFEVQGKNIKTGETFPVACTSFVIQHRIGELPYLALIAQDITTRQRAQEKLRMFCAVVGNSPDPIAVTDMSFHPIFINQAGMARFGFDSGDEMDRTSGIDYLDECQREDVLHVSIPHLLEKGSVSEELTARNPKTGESFPAFWTAFLIHDDKTGKPVHIAVVIKDITEKKRAEDELRRRDLYLSEGQKISHTGTWAWNEAMQTSFWSPELYRVLGLNPENSSPSPEGYFECVHPLDRQACRQIWKRAVTDGTSFHHEHRIELPGKTVRHARWIGYRFSNEAGEAEIISPVMDVTKEHDDRRKMERLLEEKQALEEQLHQQVLSLGEQNESMKRVRAGEGFQKIIGSSEAIENVLNQIEEIAPHDYTVLITGETGTGKELVAHAIHSASRRAAQAMIAFNAASLPYDLAMSEIFGHEKGAFTGADSRHIGLVETASDTTLLFDEIGDMPLDLQAKFLRFLQEREFFRLGSTKVLRSNVRIMAATNRDLEVAVERGEFRRDLFHRLNEFRIHLPPLRERQKDIEALVLHFVRIYSKQLSKGIKKIEQRSLEWMQSYPWPGNIRELENVIRTAVIRTRGEVLVLDRAQFPRKIETIEATAQLPFLDVPLDEAIDAYETARIQGALTKTSGVVEAAAELLGKKPGALFYKIRTLHIDVNRYRRRPAEDWS